MISDGDNWSSHFFNFKYVFLYTSKLSMQLIFIKLLSVLFTLIVKQKDFYYFCFKYIKKHLKIAFFVIVWANLIFEECLMYIIFATFQWYSKVDVQLISHWCQNNISYKLRKIIVIACNSYAEITLTFFIIYHFIHFRVRIYIVFISFLWYSYFWCVINVIVMSNY